MVSHDRYFVDALATDTWALEPATKTITVVKGGYSAYLAYREQQKEESLGHPNGAQPKGKRIREETKAEKRVVEKRARQIAELEQVIAATELELARISQKLEEAGQAQDIPLLQELGQAYQTTEVKLEELFAQWTEQEPA